MTIELGPCTWNSQQLQEHVTFPAPSSSFASFSSASSSSSVFNLLYWAAENGCCLFLLRWQIEGGFLSPSLHLCDFSSLVHWSNRTHVRVYVPWIRIFTYCCIFRTLLFFFYMSRSTWHKPSHTTVMHKLAANNDASIYQYHRQKLPNDKKAPFCGDF